MVAGKLHSPQGVDRRAARQEGHQQFDFAQLDAEKGLRIDEMIEMQHGIEADLARELAADPRRDRPLVCGCLLQHDDDGLVRAIDLARVPELHRTALARVLRTVIHLRDRKVREPGAQRQGEVDDEIGVTDADHGHDHQDDLRNHEGAVDVRLIDAPHEGARQSGQHQERQQETQPARGHVQRGVVERIVERGRQYQVVVGQRRQRGPLQRRNPGRGDAEHHYLAAEASPVEPFAATQVGIQVGK